MVSQKAFKSLKVVKNHQDPYDSWYDLWRLRGLPYPLVIIVNTYSEHSNPFQYVVSKY